MSDRSAANRNFSLASKLYQQVAALFRQPYPRYVVAVKNLEDASMKIRDNYTKAIAFIRGNLLGILLIAGFALAAIKILSLYASIDIDDGHWQQFKTEHGCVSHTGDQGTERLSWKCEDGKIYYAWRQQR